MNEKAPFHVALGFDNPWEIAGGINIIVQMAKFRDRGYGSTKKMNVMICLIYGIFTFDMPSIMHHVTHTK